MVESESKKKATTLIKPVEDDEEEDDCPPPLEDMTDHLYALKSIKENQQNEVKKSSDKGVPLSNPISKDDDEEEVRLAPKKAPVAATESKKTTTTSIPMRDFPEEKPKPVAVQEVKPVATTAATTEKKKESGGFGGMKAGFLFGGPPAKRPAPQ